MNKRFLLLLLYSLFTQNNLNAHGFHGCTPVITKKGAIHLHEIQNRVSKNQTLRVLTYNTPHDQCCIERRVHTANEGETNCYCRIQFDDNRNNDIVCSPSQEFYLLPKKQLTPAYKLKKGHRLLSQHNQSVEVKQISFIEKPLKIYSIQVNDNHNFFIGNHAILTHNMIIPAAVSVGIGTSFGSGAAAGGAAGSYFGPITLCGGIVVGGVLGILYHTFFGSNNADSYQAEYDITQMKAYFAQNNQQQDQKGRKNRQAPGAPMPPDDEEDGVHPSTPVYRRGMWKPEPKIQEGLRKPTIIYGRQYSGHAVERMQGRGLTPTAIENTIKNGTTTPNKVPGRLEHFDQVNNIQVITCQVTGNIISIF